MENFLEKVVDRSYRWEEIITHTDFATKLIEAINIMIDNNDLDRLFRICYRIDVDEKKLDNAMKDNNVAEQIAQLLITRIKKILEMRSQYKSPEIKDDDLSL